jgi:regulator of sigma D
MTKECFPLCQLLDSFQPICSQKISQGHFLIFETLKRKLQNKQLESLEELKPKIISILVRSLQKILNAFSAIGQRD